MNFISIVVYLCAAGISFYFLTKKGISVKNISLLDLGVLMLATYRVARMIVYEKVFSLIRFWVLRYLQYPIARSLNNLITCPWCTAVWVALLFFDVYYMVPYGKFFVYVMAISGVASPLILIGNNLTMRNNALKKQQDNS